MGRNFGYSGSTNRLERGLSNCLKVYSGVTPLMFDYSKPSNEVDNLNGSSTKYTPKTG